MVEVRLGCGVTVMVAEAVKVTVGVADGSSVCVGEGLRVAGSAGVPGWQAANRLSKNSSMITRRENFMS
jgi:hypothetical protein